MRNLFILIFTFFLACNVSFGMGGPGGGGGNEGGDCFQFNTLGTIISCSNCTVVDGSAAGDFADDPDPSLVIEAEDCGPVTLLVEYSFDWDQGSSVNWIHGISFNAGPLWTSFEEITPPGWIFMPNGVTGCCSGTEYGPGYFYDGSSLSSIPTGTETMTSLIECNMGVTCFATWTWTWDGTCDYSCNNDGSIVPNSTGTDCCDGLVFSDYHDFDPFDGHPTTPNDGDPGNNWGVNCGVSDGIGYGPCPTFQFELTYCPTNNSPQDFTEYISFTTSADGESGCWCQDGGCDYANGFNITIQNACGPDAVFDDIPDNYCNSPDISLNNNTAGYDAGDEWTGSIVNSPGDVPVSFSYCDNIGNTSISHIVGENDCYDGPESDTYEVWIPEIENVTASPLTGCGTVVPVLNADIEIANTNIAWGGSGTLIWQENGTTVTDFTVVPNNCGPNSRTFTPVFNTGCLTCDVTGTPITVTAEPNYTLEIINNPANCGVATANLLGNDGITVCETVSTSCSSNGEMNSAVYNWSGGSGLCSYDFMGMVECSCVFCSAEAGSVSPTPLLLCPGETIVTSVAGNNTDPNYETIFLLVNGDDVISQNTTGNFIAPNDCGTYTIYSYNYEISGTADTNPSSISSIICEPTNCCDLSVGVSITVGADTPLSVVCPSSVMLGECSTESDIQNAYNSWSNGFTYSGGYPTVSVTSGPIPSLPSYNCGSAVNLVYDYSVIDGCGEIEMCSSSFIVSSNSGGSLMVVCPPDVILPENSSESEIQTAYNNWANLANFGSTGGCGTTNVTSGTFPNLPPYVCQAEVNLNYTYIVMDVCGNMENCTVNFLVPAGNPEEGTMFGPDFSCPNESIELSLFFTDPDGIYTITYSDGTNTYNATVSNGDVIIVNPSITTTYTFISGTLMGCPIVVSGTVEVEIGPLSSIDNSSLSSADCSSGTTSCDVCPGAELTFSASGTNLPDGETIDWYYSTSSTFDPCMGEGTLLGTSNISSPDPIICSECPEILGLMIDACNSSGSEQNNEFVILHSGSGFNVNDFQFDYADQNDGSGSVNDDVGLGSCGVQIPSASLISGLQSGSACSTLNVIPANPGTTIPADAIVLFFTSRNVSQVYDLSAYCEAEENIYIIQSSCNRSIGAFTNYNSSTCNSNPNQIRSQAYSLNGCSCAETFDFNRCEIPSPGSSSFSSMIALDGAGNFNPFVTECEVPFIQNTYVSAISTTIDDFVFTTDATMCGAGPYYVIGIQTPASDEACTDCLISPDILEFNVISDLAVTCPSDVTLPACSTETAIMNSYNSWINGFSFMNGCNPVVNSIPPSLPNYVCEDGMMLSYTYVVTDDCEMDQTCNSNFEVIAVTGSIILSSPEVSEDLGCITTAPTAPSFNLVDDCNPAATPTIVDSGASNTGDCNWTQTWTASYTPLCGVAPADVVITYTWTQPQTDPVLSSPEVSEDLGCITTAPTAPSFVLTDDCNPTATPTIVDSGANNTGDCNWTQTWTASYTPLCGVAPADVVITYTWTQPQTDPVLSSPEVSEDLGCITTAPTAPSFNLVDECNPTATPTIIDSGASNTGDCNWTQTWTASYAPVCGVAPADVVISYTWTQPQTDPVLSSPEVSEDLGCITTAPTAPSFVLTDDCNPTATPTIVDSGASNTGDCNWTQTWTASYAPVCGVAPADVVITYTWTQPQTDPVLSSPEVSEDLGCITTAPTAPSFNLVDECNPTATPTIVDSGASNTGDCNWTQTWTASYTPLCGVAPADVVISYTWTQPQTDPVLSSPEVSEDLGCITTAPTAPSFNLVDECNPTATPTIVDSGASNTGDCNWTQTWTASYTPLCGVSPADVVISYTWTQPQTDPVLSSPEVSEDLGCITTAPTAPSFNLVDECNPTATPTIVDSGASNTGDCNWTQTWTASYTPLCGVAPADVVISYTWTQPQTDPVLSSPEVSEDLGCITTAPTAPSFVLTDDCNPTATPTIVDSGASNTGDCNWTQTWTASYAPVCGVAPADVVITYTWTQPQTDPVLSSPEVSEDLGCITTAPTAPSFVLTDDCNPTATPTIVDSGASNTGDCNWTQTWTASYTPLCGVAPADVVINYTWTQPQTDPVLSSPEVSEDLGCITTAPTAPSFVLTDDCNPTATPTIVDSGASNTGDCNWTQTWTASYAPVCGVAPADVVISYTWTQPQTDPVLSSPEVSEDLGCITTAPTAPSFNLVDECNPTATPTVVDSGASNTGDCNWTQTWTASYAPVCGVAPADVVISYTWTQPQTDPVLSSPEVSEDLGCITTAPTAPSFVLTDDCNPTATPTIVDSGASNTGDCNWTQTWTASYAPVCGVAPADVVISYTWTQPQTDPVLSSPEVSEDLGCITTAPTAPSFNLVDDCNPTATPTIVDSGASNTGDCNWTQTWTASYTPVCGVSPADVVISYTWTQPQTDPVLSSPEVSEDLGCITTAPTAPSFNLVDECNPTATPTIVDSGASNTGDCNWTQTWTASYAPVCGVAPADVVISYTWTQPQTDPVLSSPEVSEDLGCITTAPTAPSFVLTDDCNPTATPTIVDSGASNTGDCNWTQTWTASYAPVCGVAPADVVITYTWTQPQTDPVLSSPEVSEDLGCITTAPTAPSFVLTDDCNPTATPTIVDSGASNTGDCNWTQTWTASYTPLCGVAPADVVITYTWTQPQTDPVLSSPEVSEDLGCITTAPTAPSFNLVDECNPTATPTIVDSGASNTGDCNWTQTWTASYTPVCGVSPADVVITYTWTQPQTDPVLSSPEVSEDLGCITTAPTAPSFNLVDECNPTATPTIVDSGASNTGDCNWTQTWTASYTPVCGVSPADVVITYTWTQPVDILLICPDAITIGSCMSQSEINLEFDNWLNSVNFSGGCNPILSNNFTGYPSLCTGSTTEITFTVNDDCNLSEFCTATFSIEESLEPCYSGQEDYTGCVGDGYEVTIGTGTYNESNQTGTETLVSANGCDSVVTINLVYLPNSVGQEDYTGCVGDGYEVTVGSGTYNEANQTGTETLVSANGCDSVVTINLIYLPNSVGQEDYTGCVGDGYEVTVGTGTYNESNQTGTETLVSANGCDSVVTINLVYLPNSVGQEDYTGCVGDGYEVTVGTGTYNESNQTGTETLVSANGCDSVVTINLVYLPNSVGLENYTGCIGDGYEVTVGSGTYNESNQTGTETLVSANGCDSIVTINLVYLPNSVGQEDYTGCVGDGYEVTVGSETYNESNQTGTETLVSANGCDSIVTINLVYLPNSVGQEDYTGCVGDGYEVTVGTGTYNESNQTGTETLVSGNGCDSVVTINLVYLPNSVGQEDYTGCVGDGYEVMVGGVLYNEANPTGTETLVSGSGCDSVVTVNLVFEQNSVGQEDYTGCIGDGYEVMVGGVLYNEANPMGSETLVSANGCDSVVTVNLIFEPNSVGQEDYTGCVGDGYEVTVGTGTYNESNQTGTETLVSANGCDSIVTINLVYLPNSVGQEDYTGCVGDGYEVMVGGVLYNEANPTGTETLVSGSGCDSVVTVNLVFEQNSVGQEDYTGCIGDGYEVMVGGVLYNEANPMGSETLVSANGCDSVVTVNLIFEPNSVGQEDYTGCVGDGYEATIGGVLYNEANPMGTVTLVSANGCDSIVTINLVYLPNSVGQEDYTGCVGDGYEVTVGTGTYNESNQTGTETLVSANGCDSVVTINLVYLPNSVGQEDYTGCFGDGYEVTVGTGTYNEANPMGTETLVSANGCDSVVTINLVYLPNSVGQEDYTGCVGDGYEVTVGSGTYNESNQTGTETLVSPNGCDSIVTINLVYLPNSVGQEDYTGCVGDGYEVTVGTGTYNEANPMGTETLVSAIGCDSVVTINLVYLPNSVGQEDYTGCVGDGYEVTVGTGTYNESNQTGTETLVSANGCDSVVTINLVYLPNSVGQEDYTGCIGDGYEVTVGTGTYNEANPTGTETLVSGSGCDSVVTVNLVFEQNSVGQEDYSGCVGDGYEVMVGGVLYNEANPTGTETLVSGIGCDSVVTVNLIFEQNVVGQEDYSGCVGDGYEVMVGGVLYNEANPTGTETLVSGSGCDSVVTVNLVFEQNVVGQEDYTGCVGDGYEVTVGTVLYNEANPTGTETLVSGSGCDSVVTVNLIFEQNVVGQEDYTGCIGDGYEVTVGGVLYNEANPIGTETLVSGNGCDSVVTVNLVYLPNSVGQEDYTGCVGDGYEVVVGTGTYNEANPTGTETLVSGSGCDSVVTVNLIFEQNVVGQEDYTGCVGDGYEVTVGGVLYNEANPTGTETLVSGSGCDSVVTVNLVFEQNSVGQEDYSGCVGDGYEVMVGGVLYNEANPTGTETLVSGIGCDSVVTVNLIFEQNVVGQEDYSGCVGDGYEVMVGGVLYNEANPTGTETLVSDSGCDSVVTVNLIFEQNVVGQEDYTGCIGDGYEVTVGGVLYNEANPTGTETLVSGSGCDSVVTVNLIFEPNVVGQEDYTGCIGDGYEVTVGTVLYNEANPMGTETLVSANGCDSVVTVNLVYLPNSVGQEDYTGCIGDGYEVMVGGVLYNEANPTGTETLVSGSGCDSVVTVNLIFEQNAVGQENYTGCIGDGYEVTVGTVLYNEANPTGTETLVSGSGCDSVVTVNLIFEQNSVGQENYTGCIGDGYEVTVGTVLYNEANPMGTETLVSANGCDSVVTINLVYLPNSVGQEDYTGCIGDGYEVMVGGVLYNEANPTGTETLVSGSGCDSVVTVNLIFEQNVVGQEDYTGCIGDGYEVTVGTVLYNEANPMGTETLVSANGCDSVVTINLVYLPNSVGQEDYTGCIGDGYEVMVGGVLYNEANPTGTETLVSGSGCDSVVTVNLIFEQNVVGQEDYTGCIGDGYEVMVGGVLYNEANSTGTETLVSGSGCDSVVTVNLIFEQNVVGQEDYTGCIGDGYEVTVGGVLYNEANPTGTETLVSGSGCDSVVTVNLIFEQNVVGQEDYTGCVGDGYEVTVGGVLYNEANPTGTETLVSGSGCDSIVTVNLIFEQNVVGQEDYSGCIGDGYEVTVGGVLYNEANPTGTETLVSGIGCDSVVTVNLVFEQNVVGQEDYTGCVGDGYEVTVGGVLYNEANPIGTETLVSGNGCDSVVTVNLVYLPNSVGQEDYTGCVGDGYEVVVGTGTYNEANPTGTETLVSGSGCDSIVTVNLIFEQNVVGQEDYTGCIGDGYEVTVGGVLYNEANPTGTETLVSGSGCDSIVTVNLIYKEITILELIAECNDANTPGDSSDDFYDITIHVNSNPVVVGSEYNVLINSVIIGAFEYGAPITFQLLADGTTPIIEIQDIENPNCIIFQTLPSLEPCSNECFLTVESITFVCDDNGTSTDASDDFYTVTFSVDILNGSNQYEVIYDGVNQGTFNYGTANSITVPADGSTQLILFQDFDNNDCNENVQIGPLEPCSDECIFEIITADLVCSDNDTPLDPSDDFYTIIVNANAINGSSQYSVDFGNGVVGPFEYNEVSNFILPADGSDVTLVFFDTVDDTCTDSVNIGVLEPCSFGCEIEIIAVEYICNDNNTPNDDSDDFYEVFVNATGTNVSTEFNVTHNFGIEGPFTYNVGGNFTLPANGNIISLSFTDSENPGCKAGFNTSELIPCSNPCELTILQSDIVCNDNGTPSDGTDDFYTITVNAESSAGNGQFNVIYGANTEGPFNYTVGGNFTISANGSSPILNFVDSENSECNDQIEIGPLLPCSFDCLIEVIQAEAICQDNDTPGDPSDDFYIVTVLASALNGSVDGYQVINGGTIEGQAIYDEVIVFNVPADGSELIINVTDVDNAACNQIINLGTLITCSSSCSIEILLSSFICNDNGTPSDPDDDYYNISVNASSNNGGTKYFVKYGTITKGPYDYNEVSNFIINANGGVVNLVFSDQIFNDCQEVVEIGPLEPCSDLCSIDDMVMIIDCNDNNTPSDPSDDFYEVAVDATGINGASSFIVTVENNQYGPFNYEEGGSFELPADGETHVMTFEDSSDATCLNFLAVGPLDPCSDLCVITDLSIDLECDDNGTPEDVLDDFYTVVLTANALNGSATGFEIFIDNVFHSNGEYGVQNFIILPANGNSPIIEIIDIDDSNCSLNQEIESLIPCSFGCIILDVVHEINCNDNNTSTDPSDDYYTIDVNVNAINSGTGYSISDGTNLYGPFNYNESNSFDVDADNSILNILISDIDSTNCEFIFEIGPLTPCSNDCLIDSISINNIICSDNNTPSDPSDDLYTFDLFVDAINSGTMYEIISPFAGSGNYGEITNFGPLNISDGIQTLVIVDAINNNCTDEIDVIPPNPCSNDCELNIVGLEIGECDDNNTGQLDGDDIYTIEFIITSTNSSTAFFVDGNMSTYGPFNYNETIVIPDLPANGLNIELVVYDSLNIDCNLIFDVVQNPCSFCLDEISIEGDSILNCITTEIDLTGISTSNEGQFEWTDPLQNTYNTQTITADIPGIYYLEFIASNNCTYIDSIIIALDDDLPLADAGLDQVITCDQESVTLGTQNSSEGEHIIYVWTNEDDIVVSTDKIFITFEEGIFTLEVIDTLLDCHSNLSEVVVTSDTELPDPEIQVNPTNIINCFVEAVELSHTNELDIVYEWNYGGVIIIDNIIFVDQEGTVYLYALDTINGCSAVDSISIIDLVEYPIIVLQDPEPLDCINTSVLLTSIGSQQGPTITYQWYDESGEEIMGATEGSITVDTPGEYYLELFDFENNCTNVDTVLVISNVFYPNVDAGADVTISCIDDMATLVGDFAPEVASTFNWTDINNIEFSTDQSFETDTEGSYVFNVVIDENGCASSDTVVVLPAEYPEFDLISSPDGCLDEAQGIIEISEIVNGTEPYSIFLDEIEVEELTIPGLSSGTYDVLVIDDLGCETYGTITVENADDIEVNIANIDIIDLGDYVDLIAMTNIPENEIDTIFWTPTDSISCINCLETDANPIYTTTYTITIIDIYGCTALASITVYVDKQVDIYVPNAFSPNDDGTNDIFTIFTKDPTLVDVFDLRIYDRWGEKVYEKDIIDLNNEFEGWDGNFKGEPALSGVYSYIFDYRIIGEETQSLFGTVTIIR